MKLVALRYELEFVSVNLVLHRNGIKNLFAMKNNKTVAETLVGSKYARLSNEVRRNCPRALDAKLGEFLYGLKMNGDKFYLQFLNKYGDRTYCDFSTSERLKARGLYYFALEGEISYIGKSQDSFEKRINQGYGHLSPKNCYRDGQATNCHLNSLVAEHWTKITFYVCALNNSVEIDALEKTLIRELQPKWNIALKQK